jgi:tRNA nucleotidyltransferase (CCA-adding enzyme)
VAAGSEARWELFSHGADVGVRGIGPTREAAFSQAACALTGVVTDPGRVRPRESVLLECEAGDDELLLAAFLNEIVFAMATRRMLFSEVDVAFDGRRLRALARGEPVDSVRHEPAVEPKGATLTELRVRRDAQEGSWVAQCVVDV